MEVKKPIIDIWYGLKQNFGYPGLFSDHINILGTIQSGNEIISSVYNINSTGEKALFLGPDKRRLNRKGDFNIEIDSKLLLQGSNTLSIKCTDNFNNSTKTEVNIIYNNQPWPLPYSVEPTEKDSIQDLVQIIDGKWTVKNKTVSTVSENIGYDRIIALGDKNWSNYQIKILARINKVDGSVYKDPISVNPSFIIMLPWRGHTDFPLKNEQPRWGWEPYGQMLWYEIEKNENDKFFLKSPPPVLYHVENKFEIKLKTQFEINVSVSNIGGSSIYMASVYQDHKNSSNSSELYTIIERDNLSKGGVAIIAHHLDIAIEKIEVSQLKENYMRKTVYRLFEIGVYIPLFLVLVFGLYKIWSIKGTANFDIRYLKWSIPLIFGAILLDLIFRKGLMDFLHDKGVSTKIGLLAIQIKNLMIALLHALAWFMILFGLDSVG